MEAIVCQVALVITVFTSFFMKCVTPDTNARYSFHLIQYRFEQPCRFTQLFTARHQHHVTTCTF
jgi:hypothetical protein